jgi:fermentation-respiration switch protein FrsA (DUF1100 family)
MRVEAWSFPNARGERLSGRLDRPDGAPRAWALFAHCLDQAARIARLGKALLILHAPQDAIVGIDNARAIFDAARHPKSFVALDGADLLLTRPGDAEFVADILAAWLRRYLDPVAVAAEAAPPGHAATRAA